MFVAEGHHIASDCLKVVSLFTYDILCFCVFATPCTVVVLGCDACIFCAHRLFTESQRFSSRFGAYTWQSRGGACLRIRSHFSKSVIALVGQESDSKGSCGLKLCPEYGPISDHWRRKMYIRYHSMKACDETPSAAEGSMLRDIVPSEPRHWMLLS